MRARDFLEGVLQNVVTAQHQGSFWLSRATSSRTVPAALEAISRRWAAEPAARLLAIIAGAYAAVQLLIINLGMALDWDEVVYVSQFAHHGPAAPFSAPRARGVPLIVAPVVLLTN